LALQRFVDVLALMLSGDLASEMLAIRLPKVLAALASGAMLAVVGSILQRLSFILVMKAASIQQAAGMASWPIFDIKFTKEMQAYLEDLHPFWPIIWPTLSPGRAASSHGSSPSATTQPGSVNQRPQ